MSGSNVDEADTTYHFGLVRNNLIVEIRGIHGVYNITINDSTKVEQYRIMKWANGTYRIGQLVKGCDDIGLEYNSLSDSYHMIWPNEDVFKEIIKLIDTIKPSMITISKNMDNYTWC